jgi:hypothetical protein
VVQGAAGGQTKAPAASISFGWDTAARASKEVADVAIAEEYEPERDTNH